MLSPLALTVTCLAFVLILLVVDHREWPLGRVIAKLSASTCFVGVAVVLGAHRSTYGQLILGALVLGWLGDALLLSRAPKAFMGGLGAFLLSHVLFATAIQLIPLFELVTQSFRAGRSDFSQVLSYGFPKSLGWLRWLMPHAPKEFKGPVLAYVVVILAMCVTAAGHAFASQRWAVLVGALLFTASDLSVARDRFVKQGYVNRLWGWPTYFVAQLVLAWTVATASVAG